MSTKTKNITPKDIESLNQKVDEISGNVRQLSQQWDGILHWAPVVGREPLFKCNELTDLTSLNRLNSLIRFANQGSLTVNTAIHAFVADENDLRSIVELFLRSNKSIINHVFKNSDTPSDLCYFILLKNDNERNRNKIFSFYDTFEFAKNSQEIFFQFVPSSLKEYFKSNKKEIILTD